MIKVRADNVIVFIFEILNVSIIFIPKMVPGG